jgi:glycosyltransferase involved in cell wall biosynthesis
VVSEIANHWAASGRDVSVVTLASTESDFFELDARVRRVGLDLTGRSGGTIHALRENVRRAIALRRALRGLRPDLAISFGDIMNCLVLVAVTGSHIRTIVSERNDPRHLAMHQPWATLRPRLYPRAEAVVVQTEGVAGWARHLIPSANTVVIPNFVPPDAGPDHDDHPAAPVRRVVAMGRLTPQKGFDLLITAFARVAGARPDWTLTIAGEGPEREALESLVADLDLQGRVTLPGVVDAREHLDGADLFVLSSRYEGFPNALMEAMAAGLAVIAFDCQSGPSEIVRDGVDGVLVPAEDTAGLASQLERLMDDPALRSRLGEAARDVVDRFSIERVMGLWEELVDAA